MRQLAFASLQVQDLEKSKDFYINKLGFEASQMSNPDACIFKYNQGEASFAIRKHIGNIEGRELGIGTSVWFAIDEEIEDLQTRLIGKQVTLAGPIATTPFGKTLVARDPDGYNITFLKAN